MKKITFIYLGKKNNQNWQGSTKREALHLFIQAFQKAISNKTLTIISVE